MKTKDFLQLLEANKDASLLFEYSPNRLVGSNYHITEVKHVKIDSVDCGTNTDNWNETIIQLWESPSELSKTEFMNSNKALGILNKVAEIRAFEMEAEVRFEYSNALFHTAQLFVSDSIVQNGSILIKLTVKKTDCKAKETCGVSEPLITAVATAETCSPGGGCC